MYFDINLQNTFVSKILVPAFLFKLLSIILSGIFDMLQSKNNLHVVHLNLLQSPGSFMHDGAIKVL